MARARKPANRAATGWRQLLSPVPTAVVQQILATHFHHVGDTLRRLEAWRAESLAAAWTDPAEPGTQPRLSAGAGRVAGRKHGRARTRTG